MWRKFSLALPGRCVVTPGVSPEEAELWAPLYEDEEEPDTVQEH